MSELKYDVKIYGSNIYLTEVHLWVIDAFGEAWNQEHGSFERWCWGYHDSGYIRLSFRDQEDCVLCSLMWS